MIDVYDLFDLLDTNKQINILARAGSWYHLLISGFKEDVLNNSIFNDIETIEVENIIADESFLAGINIVLYIEEEYFTLPYNDDRSGHIDFFQINEGTADPVMQAVYDDLGFHTV